MSNDKFDDDLPNFSLDSEDKEAYLRQRGKLKTAPTDSVPAVTSDVPAAPKSNGFAIFLLFILSIGACGGAGYLYHLNQQQQQMIVAAQKRITDLERALSSTDEEMGQSTVALQVKVQTLMEKSEELWDQMDKLWASAWRRNQSEIKDLENSTKKYAEQIATAQKSASLMEVEVGVLNTNLVALQEQLGKQQTQRSSLQNEVESVSSAITKTDKALTSIAKQLADIKSDNQALNTRLFDLELKIDSLPLQKPSTQTITTP